MKSILIIAIALFLIYLGYRRYRSSMIDNGLEGKITGGAVILDVRTSAEYNTGHIDGSINMSLGTIRKRYKELDPTKTYITTCSHGMRSIKVESLLKERGFKNVYNGGRMEDLEKIVKKQKEK